MRTVEGRVLMVAFAPGEADRRVSFKHDAEKSTVYLIRDDVRVTANGVECDLPGLVRFLGDAVGPVEVILHRDPAQYEAPVEAHFTNAGGTS